MNVEQIAEEIIAREGPYVNDPDDPGGATKYGVTIGTMRHLGLDLNSDGRVSAADVKMLTREKAKEIFLKEYFYRPKINQLPEALQPTVFDMNVNAGSHAVRLLQHLLNNLGQVVMVDGAIGPHTIKAAYQATKEYPDLVDRYGVERRNYYFTLADCRPTNRKYAKRRDGGKGGWITRAEVFMSPANRMSAAAFARRTSGWS